MNDNFIHADITEKIIKAFYVVYNKLGYGFLEKVYENAMGIECRRLGLACIVQCPIDVLYEGQKIGFYIADMIVNGLVIVEVKAVSELSKNHESQLTNYLKATEIEVGLLLNFGQKPEFRRKVFSADFK